METAEPLYGLTAHEGPVTSLVFSSDPPRLFSGSEDNLVLIWDMLTGKLVRGMTGHRRSVNCVSISEDGSVLASGSEDNTIRIWDTNSGKCTQTFSKGHHSGIRSIRFFDEDRRVIATCDRTIIAWDISRNVSEPIWTMEQFVKTTMQHVPLWKIKLFGWAVPVSVLGYITRHVLPDGDCPEDVFIAYASQSPKFVFAHKGMLYSGSLPTPTNNPPLHVQDTISTVSASPDGLWAAIGDSSGLLQIIDLSMEGETWEEMETSVKSDPFSHIGNIVPSPNGERFVIQCTLQWYLIDGDYQIVKKINIGTLRGMWDEDDVRSKFSPSGNIFLCLVPNLLNDSKSALYVFDSMTGNQRAQFSGLKKACSFAASTDGAWVACGRAPGQIDVLGVGSKARTSIGESNGSPINTLLFSDSAEEVVAGSEAGVVRVWDRASGECKAMFGASTSVVTALAYAGTRGRARIAIGREDGSLCLWSPSASASHDIVRGDQAAVKKVDIIRFEDDGARLISRGEDGTVSTWAIPFDGEDVDLARCTRCTRQGTEDVDSGAVSLPHLLSRSDPADTVDGLLHTAYRVRKDGWLVEGDRRVIWLPPFIRPQGRDTFYAYANGTMMLLMPSTQWLLLKYVK